MLLAAPWCHVPWQDWLGLALTVIGLPLALVGIWQAWRQAKRATSAAEATRLAIGQTEAALRGRVLLALLVPQLHRIAIELEIRWVETDVDDVRDRMVHLANVLTQAVHNTQGHGIRASLLLRCDPVMTMWMRAAASVPLLRP